MSESATLAVPPMEERRRQTREARIRRNVVDALGRPPDLLRVVVVPLWGDQFRVNVLTGSDASARVAHSFFVEAGEDGAIVTARPDITRAYSPPG